MECLVKEQWIVCPSCGGNTRTKVRNDTVLYHHTIFCPKCKKRVSGKCETIQSTYRK